MARLERFGRVMMWITLAVSLFFQVLAMNGLYNEKGRGYFFAILLCCAAMLVGTVLVQAMRKFPWIGLALTVLGGFAMIFVALALRDAYPVQITVDGETGLSVWKVVYRHMICVLVPIFAAVACFAGYADRKAAELRAAARPHRPLDGDPIFKDEGKSTLDL